MTVYNAVGEGPLSPPQEVFVGEAGEPACPAARHPSRLPEPSPLLSAAHGHRTLTTPVTSSAHDGAPQRGRPRPHGHTAGRDVGATAAGEPEWRHPGLQGRSRGEGQAGVGSAPRRRRARPLGAPLPLAVRTQSAEGVCSRDKSPPALPRPAGRLGSGSGTPAEPRLLPLPGAPPPPSPAPEPTSDLRRGCWPSLVTLVPTRRPVSQGPRLRLGISIWKLLLSVRWSRGHSIRL